VTRRTSGRINDRIVGRDLLVGAETGSAVAALNQISAALPYSIDLSNCTPADANLNFLADLRAAVGATRVYIGAERVKSFVLVSIAFRCENHGFVGIGWPSLVAECC